MPISAKHISVNNYHQIVKDNGLNKRQEMVLEYFWMFSNRKFTVNEVVKRFQDKLGSGITKDSIAPRITELMKKGLVNLVGTRREAYIDYLTGKEKFKERGEYQLANLSEQPSLF